MKPPVTPILKKTILNVYRRGVLHNRVDALETARDFLFFLDGICFVLAFFSPLQKHHCLFMCIFRTGFLMWSIHFSPHINAIFDVGSPGSQSPPTPFAKTLLLVIVAGLVGNYFLALKPLAPMLESTSKINLQ